MSESTSSASQAGDSADLRRSVAEGLAFAHTRLNADMGKTLEATSFLYALIELLSERGLVAIDELDERKNEVADRLSEQVAASGNGVMLQDPEYDKYAFDGEVEIDCAARVHLCHAACCKLTFALSRQDVQEGIVRWDLGRPYLVEQREDGYCTHLECDTLRCAIHPHRPVPCRAFDCRDDKRIWLDFEQRVPNPNITQPDWPRSEAPQGPGTSAA